MVVTSLFTVQHVTPHEGGETVKLCAEYGTTKPEERSSAKYKPSGEMEFFVSNDAFFGVFEPGEKFYITFFSVRDDGT